ncbi:hypothetical protein [Paenibacillus sp. J22TS3]|nr:hypothetical protein [Paenibacillus sp. J22TS3]GIP23405.1 hypothetical protein J22TS3_36800 [Paenibacillus sp. J22TS3]
MDMKQMAEYDSIFLAIFFVVMVGLCAGVWFAFKVNRKKDADE